MVFDLLGQSIYDWLKDNSFCPFPPNQVQYFARQLLTSVACMTLGRSFLSFGKNAALGNSGYTAPNPFVIFLFTSLAPVEADSHGFEAGKHLAGERCLSSSAIQGNNNNSNGLQEWLLFYCFGRVLTKIIVHVHEMPLENTNKDAEDIDGPRDSPD